MKMVKRYRFYLFCHAVILGGLVFGGFAPAHEFEDGFIERSVSYVVENDTLIVEYSVGLNPNTMMEQLAKWEIAVPEELLPGSNDRGGSDEAASDGREAEAEQKNKMSADRAVPDGHSAIEVLFRKEAGKRIQSGLAVSINGKPLRFRLISNDLSATHHVNMTVRLESKLVGNGVLEVLAQDRNFLGWKGGVRYAFKSRGRAMVHSTNAEPTLIRSERVELGKIRKDAREKYTRVVAKVQIGKPPDDD